MVIRKKLLSALLIALLLTSAVSAKSKKKTKSGFSSNAPVEQTEDSETDSKDEIIKDITFNEIEIIDIRKYGRVNLFFLRLSSKV